MSGTLPTGCRSGGSEVPTYSRHQTSQYDLEEIQNRIGAFAEVFSQELFDGVFIESKSLTANETTLIPHGLGRAYQGALITSISARPCRVSVGLSADQTVATGVWVPVEFNTETYDEGGDWDTSAYVFTPPENAYYDIVFQSWWRDSIADGAQIGVRVDGSSSGTWYGYLEYSGAAAGNKILSWAGKVALAGSESVTLDVTHGHGSDRDLRNASKAHITIEQPSPYINSSSSADSSLYVPMWSNRDCTVDVWVY